jgi:hypothetical protein
MYESRYWEGCLHDYRFQEVAGVYRTVAEDSELGKEQPDARVRGKTVNDVTELLAQGMKAKKLKSE